MSRDQHPPAAPDPGSATPDLAELLVRVQAGDQEACRIVYHRHAPKLVRVIRRCFMPKDSPLRLDMDSSDLAQEAWLSMFELVRKGQPLPSEPDFFRLLTAVLRNRFLKHRRARSTLKRSQAREEPMGPALQGQLAGGDDPAEVAAAADELRRTRPA